jgi:hypothetical protein
MEHASLLWARFSTGHFDGQRLDIGHLHQHLLQVHSPSAIQSITVIESLQHRNRGNKRRATKLRRAPRQGRHELWGLCHRSYDLSKLFGVRDADIRLDHRAQRLRPIAASIATTTGEHLRNVAINITDPLKLLDALT